MTVKDLLKCAIKIENDDSPLYRFIQISTPMYLDHNFILFSNIGTEMLGSFGKINYRIHNKNFTYELICKTFLENL